LIRRIDVGTFLHFSRLCAAAAKDVFCEQVWGCGGTVAQESQQKQKAWEKGAISKEQNRKVLICDWF